MFLKLPFAISFSVFIFYNTRYFVNHLERFTCHYEFRTYLMHIYIYVCVIITIKITLIKYSAY